MGGACIVVHWCVWSGTGGFTQAPAYRRLREEVGWVSSGWGHGCASGPGGSGRLYC